jgi:hypothetical protein
MFQQVMIICNMGIFGQAVLGSANVHIAQTVGGKLNNVWAKRRTPNYVCNQLAATCRRRRGCCYLI